jgi:hypothetical protein
VRTSEKHENIYGGTPEKVFHYLGASLFIAALPSALLELLARQGFGSALIASLSLVALSLIALFIYALFERPALDRRQPADEGWTAEKARTSGL